MMKCNNFKKKSFAQSTLTKKCINIMFNKQEILKYAKICYLSYKSHEKIYKLLKNTNPEFDNIKFDYVSRWGKTHKTSYAPSSATDNVIEQYDLVNFKNFLQQNMYEYLDNLNYQGNREYKMESWVSAFELNDYGHIHDHGTADFSGVYYFQTNMFNC